MIALDVERFVNAFRAGERRWIEKDQVIALCDVLFQPLERVGSNQFVMPEIEPVQLEVATGPIEVRVRHVDRGARARSAERGVHGRRSGISEKIEKAQAVRTLAQQRTSDAMIQKQTRVEIVGEIH